MEASYFDQDYHKNSRPSQTHQLDMLPPGMDHCTLGSLSLKREETNQQPSLLRRNLDLFMASMAKDLKILLDDVPILWWIEDMFAFFGDLGKANNA